MTTESSRNAVMVMKRIRRLLMWQLCERVVLDHHLVHVDVRVDDLEALGGGHVVLHLLDVALLLGASILKPGDHLGRAERELGGDAIAIVRRQVALIAEALLQLEDLVGREGGAVLSLALERRRGRGRRARVMTVMTRVVVILMLIKKIVLSQQRIHGITRGMLDLCRAGAVDKRGRATRLG